MTDNTRPSYLDFLKTFFYRRSEYSLTSNEQLLYHSLLLINNSIHWVEWFRYTDEDLKVFTRMGITAIRNARNALKQYGMIDFVPSKARGTSTKYKICDTFCTYQINLQTNYKQPTNEVQTNYKPNAYKDIDGDGDINTGNNPPLSPKGDKSAKSKFNPEEMILDFTDDVELQAALKDFVKMRKSIRKPLTTARAFKGVFNRLAELSSSTAEQVQLVNTAVERNWLTVYKSDTSNISGGKNLSPMQRLQQETLENIIN